MRFKKAYRKSWTLDLWSGRNAWTLDSCALDSRIPDNWTLELCTTGPLDSWTLDDCTLGIWTSRVLDLGHLETWSMDDWALGLWTLGARKFLTFLVTSIYFLLLVNADFLIISSTLRLMYLWFCWTCCEWLLLFEPVAIDIIIQIP